MRHAITTKTQKTEREGEKERKNVITRKKNQAQTLPKCNENETRPSWKQIMINDEMAFASRGFSNCFFFKFFRFEKFGTFFSTINLVYWL
jgi:hypothetical protein